MRIENWTLKQWHCSMLIVIALLVLAHVIDLLAGRPFWPVTQSTYMGYESNIPTWFSGGILGVSGIYAFLCYRQAALKHIKPKFGWLLLMVMMIGLSCDEVAMLHERFGGYMAKTFAANLSQSFSHTAWPIILGPVGIAVSLALGWILYSHLKGASKAGFLMLAGAIVLLGSGILLESSINLLSHDKLQWLWNIQVVVEETGELVGAWLIGLGLVTRLDLYAAASGQAVATPKAASTPIHAPTPTAGV